MKRNAASVLVLRAITASVPAHETREFDGKEIIRLSTVLANPFPREASPEGDILTVRIDAQTEEIAAKLRSVADGFLPE